MHISLPDRPQEPGPCEPVHHRNSWVRLRWRQNESVICRKSFRGECFFPGMRRAPRAVKFFVPILAWLFNQGARRFASFISPLLLFQWARWLMDFPAVNATWASDSPNVIPKLSKIPDPIHRPQPEDSCVLQLGSGRRHRAVLVPFAQMLKQSQAIIHVLFAPVICLRLIHRGALASATRRSQRSISASRWR